MIRRIQLFFMLNPIISVRNLCLEDLIVAGHRFKFGRTQHFIFQNRGKI